jgi:hypothetical protein
MNKYAITGIVALAAAVTLAAFTPRLAHAKAPEVTKEQPPINSYSPIIVKRTCEMRIDELVCTIVFADGTTREDTTPLGTMRKGFTAPHILK